MRCLVGILGRMYRLLTVAGPTQAGQADRRPLQLQINEARRELGRVTACGEDGGDALRARIHEMESVLTERNVHGVALEKQGQLDAAMALYEANVDDMFCGSHPYERLMFVYSQKGALEDAQRVARACLAHAIVDLPETVRARCLAVLQADLQG